MNWRCRAKGHFGYPRLFGDAFRFPPIGFPSSDSMSLTSDREVRVPEPAPLFELQSVSSVFFRLPSIDAM